MATSFYALLPDYTRRRVALLRNREVVSLPKFSNQDDARFNTVSGVNSAVKASWNIPVTVFRCLDSGENGHPAVFALHNHDENARIPAAAEWVDVSQLGGVTFESEEQHLAVLDWLSSEKDDSWQNVPWSSSSWFDKATAWINKTVQDAGATVIGEPVQVRVWAISCVLRVATTAGVLYFKASPHFWNYEPIVARYMSDNFPQHMVDVVAIEPQQHWMLTKEWAGSPPETREDWRRIFQVLREIQRHCDSRLDALVSLGCKSRGLNQLPTLLQPVFDELKQHEMRKLYGVNEDESAELARRLHLLPELCDRLGQYGIADTLIHGDLWGSNVIVRDTFSGRSPVIFDWTDAAVTHPFFDIYCTLTSEKDDVKRREERQAHIDIWTENLPQKVVEQALDASERVAPYYYLLAYRNVQLNTPPQSRWELSYLLQRFVRKILQSR